VVVAVAATGSEGIAHPEAVLGRQTVGDVGEGGGAFVRRHHQVVVVFVVTYYPLGRLNAGIHQVVGDVQKAADEGLVGRDTFGLECLAI